MRWRRLFAPDPACDPDAAAHGKPRTRRLNSWRGGSAAQLRYFESHWKRLWQRELPQQSPALDAWLQELDGLPPFPQRTVWTAAAVRSMLDRMAAGKAPGLDGRSVSKLRLLSDALLDWVSQLIEAVEAQGSWPEQLCKPEGLLLPKGNGGGRWTVDPTGCC